MLLNELGQHLRAQCKRLGLKQNDIANALQVIPQAVSKWERGERICHLGQWHSVSTDRSRLAIQLRAAQAATSAQRLIGDNLVIGLSSGEIYLGAMGHPDYAHPDITSKVVNIAFIAREWAETNIKKGIAATQSVSTNLDETFSVSQPVEINFRGMEN